MVLGDGPWSVVGRQCQLCVCLLTACGSGSGGSANCSSTLAFSPSILSSPCPWAHPAQTQFVFSGSIFTDTHSGNSLSKYRPGAFTNSVRLTNELSKLRCRRCSQGLCYHSGVHTVRPHCVSGPSLLLGSICTRAVPGSVCAPVLCAGLRACLWV